MCNSPTDAIEKLLTGFVQKVKKLIPDYIARYQFGFGLIEQLGLQVEEADESFIVLGPEAEPDELDDDEVGDDLFTPHGYDSEEGLDYGEPNPAVDEAGDQPTITTGQQKRHITL